MSFGGQEFAGEISFDQFFTTPVNHRSVTFLASSGDNGAFLPGSATFGVSYPAASPNVVAVGGTTLNITGNSYSGETGWGNGSSSGVSGGSGGGISAVESQPTYQLGVVTQNTLQRAVPDVSMDADPATGVPVYDTFDYGTATPWIPGQIGGTSLACPMYAGIIAIADQSRSIQNLDSLDGPSQTLPRLYQLPGRDFNDITTGDNGFSATIGYDMVTGLGSPIANLLIPDLTGPFLGNKVFNDVNVNGIQDDLSGISGVQVTLRTPGTDGVIGTSDDGTVATTTTDPNGGYSFSQMQPGTYYIHFDTPPGFHISPAFQGGNPANDSNPDPTTGNTSAIVVTAATWDSTIDCGMFRKTITIGDATAFEGNSGFTLFRFTVTLDPVNDAGVAVSYSTSDGSATVANNDYVPTSGTLTFAPGILSQTIVVDVVGDTNIELDETFFVNISTPTGYVATNNRGTGTIVNDDFPTASVSSFTATRPNAGNINYPFFISLSAPAPFPVTVPFATIDNTAVQGIDFQFTSGSVVFPPNTVSIAPVDVVVFGGTNPQLDKTFFLGIGKSTTVNLGSPSQGVGTILTNVPPAVSVEDATVTESLTGLAYLPFRVGVAPALSAVVSVDYTTSDGTAVAGLDYEAQSGTLTFHPGQIEQTVLVPVFRRFITSGDRTKTLTLTLSNIVASGTPPLLGRSLATGTVQDQAVVTLPFSATQKAIYTDYLDHRVTIQLKGAGSGNIVFLGSSSTSTDAFEIVADGTNAGTSLFIKSAGGQTSFRNMIITGSMGTINGKTANLLGQLSVSGGLNSATLNFVQAGTISVGVVPGGSVGFTFSRVLDTSIASLIPIRSIFATAYLNTDGVPDTITAPSIGSIVVKGTFGGTKVITTSVASVLVGGSIAGTSILTSGDIGTVLASSIADSTFFAGVRSDLTSLPSSADDFVNKAASIKKVKVRAAGGFSNTMVAGWKVGALTLGTVQTANGGSVFGVSGGAVASVRSSGDTSIHATKIDSPVDEVVSANFVVRPV